MPRRKHWRKSDSKKRERSRTDESETTVTGKYTGSPEQLLRQGSPEQLLRQGSLLTHMKLIITLFRRH